MNSSVRHVLIILNEVKQIPKLEAGQDNLCELYSTAAGCSVMIKLSPPHQCSQSTSDGLCCNGAEQSQSYDGAAGGGSERVE